VTWNELYLQTVFDSSVAPAGVHTLSVFAQYVPYQFRDGSWDTRREEVGRVVVDSIARFCSNLPEAIIAGLARDGVQLYRWNGPGTQLVRLVCAFNTTAAEVDDVIARAQAQARAAAE